MRVPILTYQSMGLEGSAYPDNHLRAFAEDLRTVADAGFRIAPLRQVVDAWLEGRGAELERTVAFCIEDGSDFDFDDLAHPTLGPQRSAFHALEDLRRDRPELNPHATSFVVVSPAAREALDRACMGGRGWWGDHWWRPAVASGLMHVANHSWDHNHESLPADLAPGVARGTFRSIDRRERADLEVRQAAEHLRRAADNPGSALFAYPHGEATPYLADSYFPRFGDELGLVAAFTDRAGFLDDDQDRWRLPRFMFGRDWRSPEGLHAILQEALRPAPVFVEGREAIADPEDASRYRVVPRVLADWMAPHGGLAGREILDFGCGQGISALAVATKYGARRVVGVDIGPDPAACPRFAREQLGMRRLPPNFKLHRIEPGELHDPDDRFDLVYSWSVFEHVDQRLMAQVLATVRDCLKPGGFFFAQIAPLYYSSEGSHLHHKLREPWVHLLTQHNVLHDRLAAATPDPAELAELWGTYETLNRVTADELVEHVRAAGFEILRTHHGTEGRVPGKRLNAVFDAKILRTHEVVVLARRP